MTSDGNVTSSIEQIWHNLNSPRSSYVFPPAPSDHYAVYVIFNVEHDNLPRSIRFRDYSETDVEQVVANIDNEFLYCSPPNSNPNE